MTLVRKYWIWVAIIVVTLATIVAAVFAAQDPSLLPPQAPARQLAVFSAVPLYSDGGALVSLHCTATFRVTQPHPDGVTKTPVIRSVEFDLVQQGGQSVVLGNQLVEFGDIGADLVGVSDFAWRLNNPDPLPVIRRRALRSQ